MLSGTHPGKLLLVLAVIFLAGCLEYGTVDQGRAVAVDMQKKTVTYLRDMSVDPRQPDFVLPAVTVAFPDDPRAMGPQPRPGLRLGLDTAKRQAILYDPDRKRFDTIPIQIVDKQEGIGARHPLVFDAAANKPKSFPVVDREKGIVVIYDKAEKLLVSFIPPAGYLELSASAWDVGDVIRIYSKKAGQALRLMNVTRTDIFAR